MSSNQKTERMSQKDAETTEVSTTAPEETAPVMEGVHQQGTCADSAQVPDPVGTQTPPLKGPTTPELTGSPTTNSGYTEAAPRRESEEQEDQRALRAAPLCAQSPSPEPQPAGPIPSPDKDTEADTQPELEGEDIIGTSSPAGDSNVHATPAATPPPAPEGEDGTQMPPGALFPLDDPQLRVSPKKKVETMDLDMDSSAELPDLQKKARADSGRSSAGDDDYQWDNIPPPRNTDQRLAGRSPWGNEILVMGKPFSEFSSSEDLSRGRHAESQTAPLLVGTSYLEARRVEEPALGRQTVYIVLPRT